jgi:catechol 2,3-dioxygenase-like lactoylglutathione lyase family enzyme
VDVFRGEVDADVEDADNRPWQDCQGKEKSMSTRRKTDTPKIFRVTLEVSNIEEAAAFYAKLLGTEGKRHPGARHYFDCGGVILAVLDPTSGGLTPTPAPKSLYFAVSDTEAVLERATALKALAPYKVHGEPAGKLSKRPWGERSFYVVDPWGNDLCFVEEGTLYT